MLGLEERGISGRGIMDVTIAAIQTANGSACLDVRHRLLFDLQARASVVFSLDIQHELGFDLKIRARLED